MTSFYSSSLDKYTAFQAHHKDIRQLQPTMGGIVSVTENEVKLSMRTGLPLLTLRDATFLSKINCMLYLDDSSLLVGCQTNKITTIDLSLGQIVREVNSVCVCMGGRGYGFREVSVCKYPILKYGRSVLIRKFGCSISLIHGIVLL